MTDRVDREIDRYLAVVRRIGDVAPERAPHPETVSAVAAAIRAGRWPGAGEWCGEVDAVLDGLEAAARAPHERAGEDVTLRVTGWTLDELDAARRALASGDPSHLPDETEEDR